jgi:hypothetical protein
LLCSRFELLESEDKKKVSKCKKVFSEWCEYLKIIAGITDVTMVFIRTEIIRLAVHCKKPMRQDDEILA